jgi:hypothetical protein
LEISGRNRKYGVFYCTILDPCNADGAQRSSKYLSVLPRFFTPRELLFCPTTRVYILFYPPRIIHPRPALKARGADGRMKWSLKIQGSFPLPTHPSVPSSAHLRPMAISGRAYVRLQFLSLSLFSSFTCGVGGCGQKNWLAGYHVEIASRTSYSDAASH